MVTHCIRGHEFTTENTGYKRERNGGLGRVCKTCDRAKHIAYNAARRVAYRAARTLTASTQEQS